MEAELKTKLAVHLEAQKQEIFDKLHPGGTATSVKVHSLTLSTDFTEFKSTFTLYWKGLIEPNGYTKMECTYDLESDRFTAENIISTNSNNAKLNAFILESIIHKLSENQP
jgi:hypothetical protein